MYNLMGDPSLFFPGAGDPPPTHHPSVAHSMVGSPEGALGHQGRISVEATRRAVNPRHLERLFEVECREQSREASCQQRLPGSSGTRQNGQPLVLTETALHSKLRLTMSRAVEVATQIRLVLEGILTEAKVM